MTRPYSRAELPEMLIGPIPSIRIPFTPNGEIDENGLRTYIERCLAPSPQAVMLTYGDSLFSLLSDSEIAHVTKIVVDQIAGRSIVIAADGSWWTKQSIEFAVYCREIDADILMVLPPDWTKSGTPQSLTDHYGAISAEIPVLLVSAYLPPRGVASSMRIIESVYQQVAGVVGIKDDFGGEFGRRMTAHVAERWAVIAGGSKQLHTSLLPYGCQSYLSTLLVYAPEIASRYWDAVQANETSTLGMIVREIDIPMFDLLAQFSGGFDAALHGWSELIGISPRWRRSPYHSLTDTELDDLAAGLTSLGLLKA